MIVDRRTDVTNAYITICNEEISGILALVEWITLLDDSVLSNDILVGEIPLMEKVNHTLSLLETIRLITSHTYTDNLMMEYYSFYKSYLHSVKEILSGTPVTFIAS